MKVEPSRNETSLDTDWPNTKQALQVVIAYNDLAAGKRAMHVLVGMGKGLADHIEFRPFPWSFELVTDADWRDVVASDAVKADILILATSDTNPLPAEVMRWVEKPSSAENKERIPPSSPCLAQRRILTQIILRGCTPSGQ